MDHSAHSKVIFKMFVTKYINILSNQFRKELKDKLNYQKKLAHRAAHKGHTSKKTLLYKEIVSTTEPDRTHEELREEVKKDDSCLLQKMTVPELIHIAYGYKLSLKRHHGKKNIIAALKTSILENDSILNTSFTESKRPAPSKKTNKNAKKRKVEEEYLCPKCSKPYDSNTNSIYCENCCGWLHQDCAGIPDSDWTALSQSDDPWVCAACLAVCTICRPWY